MRIGLYREEIYDRKYGMCCYDTLGLRVSTYQYDLEWLESLALNNYKGTIVLFFISVCLRERKGSSMGEFDNTKLHRYFDLFYTCFIIVLPPFSVLCGYFFCISDIWPYRSLVRRNEAIWMQNEEKWEITHKATYMAFSMENSIWEMVCPTHQLENWPTLPHGGKMAFATLTWSSPSFMKARRLENGFAWSPTHPIYSYIFFHEWRTTPLDILDFGT